MRLVNCLTKEIREFAQDVPLRYAILSHTWETDELDFAAAHTDPKPLLTQFPANPSDAIIDQFQSSLKIHWACQQAIRDGYSYLWADTVCIDQSSPSELSEAINSMYNWYKRASVCYVYMFDVDVSLKSKTFSQVRRVTFAESRWFTRGWTLQELIAPNRVVFFDYAWRRITTKHSSGKEIRDATGIDEMTLRGSDLRMSSVARIMSWAAKRETTRVEDTAYSLLGLFDISMPLIYGEGRKAFERLQMAIIEKYDDQSLFAWKGIGWYWLPVCGVLAPSPANFVDAGNIYPIRAGGGLRCDPPTVSSRGIRFSSCRIDSAHSASGTIVLNCLDVSTCCSTQPSSVIAIPIGFIDQTRQQCQRRKFEALAEVDCFDDTPLHSVYALATGETGWDPLVTSVIFRNQPTWPQGHLYSLVEANGPCSELPALLKIKKCVHVVYRKRVPPDSIDQPYLVVYVARISVDTLVFETLPETFIAVRSHNGYKSVQKSLEMRGADLQPSEVSRSAVEYREPGLRLNIRMSSPGQGQTAAFDLQTIHLDILAFPNGDDRSYSRAEEWRPDGKFIA